MSTLDEQQNAYMEAKLRKAREETKQPDPSSAVIPASARELAAYTIRLLDAGVMLDQKHIRLLVDVLNEQQDVLDQIGEAVGYKL